MPKIKVIHILSVGNIGGAERSTEWLSRHFNNEYFSFYFIFLYCGGPIEESIRRMGYPTFILNWKGGFTLMGRIRLMKLINKIKPDIIHVHDNTPLTSIFIRATTRKPIIKSQHGFTLKSKIHKLGYSLDDRVINLVFANSNYTAQLYQKIFHRSHTTIKTIYLGLDTEKYHQVWNNGRRVTPIGNRPVNIAFLGRLELIKGILDLPYLAAKLAEQGIDFKIWVAGDGPAKNQVVQLAESLGVHSINFVGWVQDAVSFLSKSDILVFPSHIAETFGLVPLEGIACGLAIVAYEVGGVTEILRNAPGAYLIPPKNINKMAETIVNISKNPYVPKMDQCKDFILQNFDIKRTAEKYEEIYRRMSCSQGCLKASKTEPAKPA